ncbi:hypothetical protein C8Q80DRAFT_1357232 [Daedaleopsis nitida]|nr:hypothetical protein C8Q80DRAFT_1357232 [Daedaleopsis nitida]
MASFLVSEHDSDFQTRVDSLLTPAWSQSAFRTPTLSPFVNSLWTQHMQLIIRLTLSSEPGPLGFLLGHIPDVPSHQYQVTPRILSLLAGIPKKSVMDALYPFRSVILLSGDSIFDAELYLLHPICRLFLDDVRTVGPFHPPTTKLQSEMDKQLTISCLRVIHSSLTSVPDDSLLLLSKFMSYAHENRPPVADPGDLQFAFARVRECPVGRDLLEIVRNDMEADLVARFMKIPSAILDELYLWLCVMPRTASSGLNRHPPHPPVTQRPAKPDFVKSSLDTRTKRYAVYGTQWWARWSA